MIKPVNTKSIIPEMPEELMTLQKKVIEDFSKAICNNENEIVIEALKRKGFEFKNRIDLENFIKANCKGAQKDNETTYYVKDIPFLLVVRPPFEPKVTRNESGEISISAESFKYSFL